MKKTIVFDFDGVIHRYSKGWQDGSIYDKPTNGIKETIEELRKEYRVVIVSTRSSTEEGRQNILKWLNKYNIQVDDILAEKPPAVMYVDDRACKTLMRDIRNFRCWTEKARNICHCCGKEFFIDDNSRRQKYCSIDCRVKANIEMTLNKKGE